MPLARGLRLLAHRGGAAGAPENTLAAVAHARALGADGLELDVRLSADGEPFLFHDDDGARVLGRPGPVAALRWRELRELKAFGRHPVPHLDDALRALEDWPGAALTLDLHAPSLRLAEAVARRVGPSPACSRTAVLGFWRDRGVLLRARETDGRVRLSVMPGPPWDIARSVRLLAPVEVCLGWDRPLTRLAYRAACRLWDAAGAIRALRAQGLAVSGGVANTPAEVAYLLAQGVDGIWTDDLAMARRAADAGMNPASAASEALGAADAGAT